MFKRGALRMDGISVTMRSFFQAFFSTTFSKLKNLNLKIQNISRLF